ncbi:MAG: DUF2807 domain-containing protein [Flavobacteriaceae bacterium]|nr:DUF2807 domain-containing protein [Flavobacteriaceae bacterium]RZV62389.1 MAG: DUF2807 domain-containing protein [Flavobacteriaceae bacterium]
MNKIIRFFALVITASVLSQNPIEKEIGDFSEIKVYDLIEVNLVKSDNNRISITGEDVDDVQVINKDGKLKIRMSLDKIFNGTKTFVAVYYNKVEIIDSNEGAFVSSNEMIEQDKIVLRSQEGARIKVGLKVNNLEARAVTGGIIETHGIAESQDITLYTGGVYEGKDFETKDTKVTIRAAGEAEVKASNIVDAKLRAGGDVYIYGKPRSVKEDKMFGGRIKRMN